MASDREIEWLRDLFGNSDTRPTWCDAETRLMRLATSPLLLRQLLQESILKLPSPPLAEQQIGSELEAQLDRLAMLGFITPRREDTFARASSDRGNTYEIREKLGATSLVPEAFCPSEQQMMESIELFQVCSVNRRGSVVFNSLQLELWMPLVLAFTVIVALAVFCMMRL